MKEPNDDILEQHFPERKPDMRSKYEKAVADIRDNPRHIIRYQGMFRKILEPLAESHGELSILHESVYFMRNGTPLTDFGAIPLRIIKRHYVDRTDDSVELLIIGQGISSLIVQVSAKDLGSAQWIEKLGINFIYERQEIWILKILIQTMAKLAPVEEEFLYSGWAPDDQNSYAKNGKRIYGDDWSIDRVKASCRHTLKMLDVAPRSVTMALLAISILSLVQSKMVRKGNYFKGVCCIAAQTQSFKTTLASLFFDLENGTKADISFESSIAAITRTIGNARDSTVILDDYKPGATKAECKDMLQKISTVIRMCSDDSGGIKRAGVQNETITNIARCLVVVTAEHVRLDVQSTLARLLILELNGKIVEEKKITYFQKNHALYRECIENFIRYIIQQDVDIFCEKLEQRFLQERYTLQAELFDRDVPVDNRTSDMCTWLNIAFSEFLQYALSVEAIDQKEFEEYMEHSQTTFLSIMEQQAERVAELDEAKRFFQGLQVLLDTREVHIGILQSRNINYASKDSKSAVGFRKKGYVYLKKDVAFQKVISYFRQCGKEFTISEADLRKKLADRDFIDRKNEKSYIHRLSVNHESYQCIRFSELKFDNLLGGGKLHGAEDEGEISGDWGMYQNADNYLGRRD